MLGLGEHLLVRRQANDYQPGIDLQRKLLCSARAPPEPFKMGQG
jgi:hypothetical protein